jgi:DNA (cytosine-5)-methyltransferase 1
MNYQKEDAIKAGALFAGIGGFCLGFKNQGINTEWAVENDHAAVLTYSRNIGNQQVVRVDGVPQSITDISVARNQLSEVDILHAGFPCQSFSVAGDRKGFDDPRGQLFYEIIRLTKEFGEARPSVLLLENSPNLKIGDSGSWFLELSNQIKKAGYWFRESNAYELDSFDYTEVPQKRKRLFMVAFATNKFRNGKLELNFDRASEEKNVSKFIDFDGALEDDTYYLDKNNKYYKMITEKIDNPRSILQLRKYEVRDKGVNVVPTLTANMGLGGHNVPFILDARGLRKLTEYECLKIQGFPADYSFPEEVPRAKRYQQVGNSVVPPLISQIAAAIKAKIKGERL